jgi:hypothetical protein
LSWSYWAQFHGRDTVAPVANSLHGTVLPHVARNLSATDPACGENPQSSAQRKITPPDIAGVKTDSARTSALDQHAADILPIADILPMAAQNSGELPPCEKNAEALQTYAEAQVKNAEAQEKNAEAQVSQNVWVPEGAGPLV